MLKLRDRLLVILLAVSAINSAAAQSPTSPKVISEEQKSGSEVQLNTTLDQRGTEQTPFVIKIIAPQKTESESAYEAQEREQKAAFDKRQIAIAEDLSSFTQGLFIATIILAVATVGMWIVSICQLRFTRQAANAAFITAKTATASERAYVNMSHNAPGLGIDNGEYVVSLNVKNNGRTPANVIAIFVQLVKIPSSDSLPDEPDYSSIGQRKEQEITLAAGEEFTYTKRFSGITVNDPSVINGADKLWLYGYVDFIDVSEKRYRRGYAREYVPGRPGNNLIFVTKKRYNREDCLSNSEDKTKR